MALVTGNDVRGPQLLTILNGTLMQEAQEEKGKGRGTARKMHPIPSYLTETRKPLRSSIKQKIDHLKHH